ILGLTFKENVPDVRNTKVIDIIKELEEYGVELLVHDPVAEPEEVQHEFDLSLAEEDEMKDLDCVIFAVPHEEYLKQYTLENILDLYRGDERVFVDIKSIFSKQECEAKGLHYWSL